MSTGQSSGARSTGGQRALIGAAIAVFALLSAYLVLVIITRVDSIFLPGNEITVPGGGVVPLPGVDDDGNSGSKEPINILVMGLDRRPREGDTPSRTDTIFIVSVHPRTRTAGIVGIPRDLWVDIPGKQGGTYKERINTVYVAGELGDYDQGGVGLMKDVVEENLNIKVDKYVIVDFVGFEELIDALGGIDVDVPDEVYDPYYSESELPGDYDPQHFYPGRQHMDGATALAYSRIRFSSDDLDRIQRQQRVIFAAVEKAKSLNVLKNSDSLWSKYKDTIQTDISDLLIPGYARLADQVKDAILAVSLGPATVPYTTPQGAAVLVGDDEEMARIVQSIFEEQPSGEPQPTTTPEPVRVEVQNGTGTDGLAASIVRYLASRSYPIDDLNYDNVFDGQSHTFSEIVDVDGTHRRNAFLLADWLGIDPRNVRDATAEERSIMSDKGTQILIILGGDRDYTELIQSPTTVVPGG